MRSRRAVTLSARLVVLAALLLLSAVNWTWANELALPLSWRLLGTLAVAAGTLGLAPLGWWRRLLARAARLVEPDRWFWPYGLALVVVLFTAGWSWAVFDGVMHVQDEYAYLFQARVFAGGSLTATPPPYPEHFYCPWVVVRDGRWFAIFPPGWPLILALGVLAGAPLLVNPVLAGLCLIVIYRLAARLFDARTAVLTALVCALSPFFLVLSSTAMSHTALLLLTSWVALGVLSATERRARVPALVGLACAAALAALTRPVDALVLWGAAVALPLLAPRHGTRRPWDAAIASVFGLGLGLFAYILFARFATGQWLTEPMALIQPENRFGFGSGIGLNWETFTTPGHTPWRSLVNLNFNLGVLNQDLFGWPLPALLPLLALLVFARLGWAHACCLAPFAALAAAYALYWYHGVAYGARFYFGALPYLVMLTVEALRRAAGALRQRAAASGGAAIPWVPTAAALAFAFTLLVYLPKVALVAPYPNYREINRGVLRFAEERRLHHALVFVQVRRPFHYAPAFAADELPVRNGKIIFALDRGPKENERVVALFPDRQVVYYRHRPVPSRAQEWLAPVRRLMERVAG